MNKIVFPGQAWEYTLPKQVGINPERLQKARKWMNEKMGTSPFRIVIVRWGRIIAEWHQNLSVDKQLVIHSAAKSVYSNVSGILAAENGPLKSVDMPVYDLYPEYMEVPEGGGPKPGRYAFAKDRNITLRHLICNVSGYMKPNETPGKVFHYQSYGMNVLCHALAKAYGLYSIAEPDNAKGFASLIEDRLAKEIGVQWSYSLTNFDLPNEALIKIYGYYTQIHTNARDLARLGWLWANRGRWGHKQLVPEGWMLSSSRVNHFVLESSERADWKYGYGFWTNDQEMLWPGLPNDGFTSAGADGHYCSVFPSLGLVIVQCPGPYTKPRGNPDFLALVLKSIDE